MVKLLIFRDLDMINGHIWTPTRKDLAVRKALLLNFGSSATVRLAAETEPEKIDKPKSPTCTLRPRAAESLSSICGRKELALINKGRERSNRTNTAAAINANRITLFLSMAI